MKMSKAQSEREMRDQEVLRANRELAAYFKGRRTEREARAALKIIKAFIRAREHADPDSRQPLPGGTSAAAGKRTRPRKTEVVHKRSGRKIGRQRREHTSKEARGEAGASPTSTTAKPDESS